MSLEGGQGSVEPSGGNPDSAGEKTDERAGKRKGGGVAGFNGGLAGLHAPDPEVLYAAGDHGREIGAAGVDEDQFGALVYARIVQDGQALDRIVEAVAGVDA